MIFVDHYTIFTWFFSLVYKPQVFSVFEKFCAFTQNRFKTTIQYFQSNGGRENTSLVFKKFLDLKGIVHLVSCPYSPQQNEIAERKHRHIIEIAITLLSTSSLPHFGLMLVLMLYSLSIECHVRLWQSSLHFTSYLVIILC